MRRPKDHGFTLIELIAVILIVGIIVAVAGFNIARPILGFVDTTRRVGLVDGADTALNRLTREARLALPNSLRISGTALEFLRTRTGGRYRAALAPVGASDPLNLAATSDSFDVIGELKQFGQIQASGGATTTTCLADPTVDCMVLFNTGNPPVTSAADCVGLADTNAYCGDNVAAVDSFNTVFRTLTFRHDPGNAFPFASPNQRFHIVDTPVSYVCDLGTGELQRFDRYAITAAQPTSPPGGVTPSVLVDDVVSCQFTYNPGSASRAGLLTVRLTVADANAVGEQVSIVQQIHIPNVP
ncbi:MAG: type II secretion system protein [Pseudomonadota bacterium]